MKKRWVVFAFIFGCLLGACIMFWVELLGYSPAARLTPDIAAAQPIPMAQVAKHIGPNYLYPDPKLTPGKTDTLNVADLTRLYNGQTYSQSHRNVSETTKKQVYAEYRVSFPQPTGKYEVDHFYPECGGGNNGLNNLWLQPAVNQWQGQDFGFHAKDKLESEICRRIKAGTLDPAVAFKKLTADWVGFYLELFP